MDGRECTRLSTSHHPVSAAETSRTYALGSVQVLERSRTETQRPPHNRHRPWIAPCRETNGLEGCPRRSTARHRSVTPTTHDGLSLAERGELCSSQLGHPDISAFRDRGTVQLFEQLPPGSLPTDPGSLRCLTLDITGAREAGVRVDGLVRLEGTHSTPSAFRLAMPSWTRLPASDG